MEDFSASILADLDLDSGPIGIEDTMDAYWEKQYGYVNSFEQYVREWIESVDTSRVKPRRRALIGSDDFLLLLIIRTCWKTSTGLRMYYIFMVASVL